MKILSIDFDTIMYPCIRLYNDDVNGSENATMIWNGLERKYDIQNYIKYDSIVYHNIVKIILKNCQNGAKLVPIINHEEIVDYLKGQDLLSESHDIINIDFHHDVAYNEGSLGLYEFDTYTCADWGGYLLTKNKDTSFKWMRCPGSSDYDVDKVFENFTVDKIQNILNLDNNYDIVFLCLSPQWVPYEYHHLYDLIVEIAQINNYSIIKEFPKEPPKQEADIEICVEAIAEVAE